MDQVKYKSLLASLYQREEWPFFVKEGNSWKTLKILNAPAAPGRAIILSS
jgi:hypothetical protein